MPERDEICLEKDSVESNMKQRFWQTVWALWVCGREGERGVDYFRGLRRETDKKEFSCRRIESRIVRIHPR